MLRVIDLTTLSGAYAARLFAEEGHEVIRVEASEGDELRRLAPFLKKLQDLEHGAFHQFLNAGKKSVTLDLESSEGRKSLLDLLGEADVLLANSPPPIGESACLAANPQLVLTKIVDDAPELCAVARSGLMSLTGHPDQAPVTLGGHIPLMAVATYVAVATAAALLARNASGRGLIATVSVRESLESFVEQAMVEYSFSGTITERRGSKGAITAVSGALPCKDGHWVISQIHRPGRWSKFVEWVQDPELSADPSLAEEENQHKRRDFILERLDHWAKRFSKTELVEQAQGLHFPASPVSTTLDLVNDPQLIARGFLTEMDHPEFGRINFPQGAIASVLGNQLSAAPKLGEHNTEILNELPKAPPQAQNSSFGVFMNQPIYFDDVAVGDAIPPREYGPLTIVDTVRWAGLQENWQHLHYDRDHVRQHNGLKTFIASGAYRQALLMRMLTDWIGPSGWLKKISVRHIYSTFEGDTMRFAATVVEKSSDPLDSWIACDLIGTNQEDKQILTGRCTLTLPRQRAS